MGLGSEDRRRAGGLGAGTGWGNTGAGMGMAFGGSLGAAGGLGSRGGWGCFGVCLAAAAAWRSARGGRGGRTALGVASKISMGQGWSSATGTFLPMSFSMSFR